MRDAQDSRLSGYDRAYQYDDIGRLKEALTSQQARDYHLTGAVGVGDGASTAYRKT